MVITEEEQKLSDKIINTTCSYFFVQVADVYQRNTPQQVKRARNFAMYILHTEFNFSIRKLSILYKMGTRNTARKIAKVKFLSVHDKLYRENLSDLMNVIK